MVTIYTDGASRGNPGPGGWGAIIIGDDFLKEIGGREERTTNNRMELTAAIRALEFVSKLKAKSFKLEAILYTDSEYVMKGITVWIHSWRKKNWRTAGKKKVLNQDLWQNLLAAVEGKDIQWRYVEGHSGHKLNDRCDEIATAFADGLSPALYDGSRDQYK